MTDSEPDGKELFTNITDDKMGTCKLFYVILSFLGFIRSVNYEDSVFPQATPL